MYPTLCSLVTKLILLNYIQFYFASRLHTRYPIKRTEITLWLNFTSITWCLYIHTSKTDTMAPVILILTVNSKFLFSQNLSRIFHFCYDYYIFTCICVKVKMVNSCETTPVLKLNRNPIESCRYWVRYTKLHSAITTYLDDLNAFCSNPWNSTLSNAIQKRLQQSCIHIIQPSVIPEILTISEFKTNNLSWTNFLHSTEYCRKVSEIFPIFYCIWNIVATFSSIIPKYFIATLQF